VVELMSIIRTVENASQDFEMSFEQMLLQKCLANQIKEKNTTTYFVGLDRRSLSFTMRS
jgi:hypothetical protein